MLRSTQRRNCRIFSGRSVPQIVAEVLAEVGYSDVSNRLAGHYPVREYCVQYEEGDFSFVSRLMEREGIYYCFTHAPRLPRHGTAARRSPMSASGY